MFTDPQDMSNGVVAGILTAGVAGILVILLISIIGFRLIIQRRIQQATVTQPIPGQFGDYQPSNINPGILVNGSSMVRLPL